MLKQLIQRLLDSRTTPSEASHSSYPDDGTVTQFYPSATSVSSWTKVVDSTIAPSDGYVIVRGKATGESYVQITAGDNPPHMERSTFAKATLNQYPILNLPIAKGKTFKVFAENTAEITVGLIKSIGGGYNLLVRRALSCLKPSFNFSLRSSCKANLSGSAVRHTLQGGLRSRPASPNMSLQRTATWGSTNLIRARITSSMFTHSGQTVTSSQEKLLDSLLVPRTSLSQMLFPLRKAIALLSAVPSQSFGSHQQWGVNTNLQTGGALC